MQQYVRQYTDTLGAFLCGEIRFLRPPAISGIGRLPPSTHHPLPTHQPTDLSSTTAVQQYVPTNPQRQHSSAAAVQQQAAQQYLWYLWYARSWVRSSTLLRLSACPGREPTVPGTTDFSRFPLAELGTFGCCVAGDIEG